MVSNAHMLAGVPTPGTVVADKYRIERVVGIGGMGVVCEATHTLLGDRVAIKFLSQAASTNPLRVQRFKREAWAAAKIKSDHVVRVTDVASLPDGGPYLVMEFLEGQDLEHMLRQTGPLPLQTAVGYLLQAMEALGEAHKLGIVHRDLKPGNLFVTARADGSAWIKVLDFGISKFTIGGDDLTKTKALMGSPLYMAPEQLASSKHVDARADVWSLGVILYELLAGASPFAADTLPQVCTKVLHAQPGPVRSMAPHLPAEIEAVLAGFLAKKPEQRFADLGVAASALVPFAGPAGQASAAFIANVLGSSAVSISRPGLTSSEISVDMPATIEQRPQIGAATASPVTTSTHVLGAPRIPLGGILAAVVALIGVGVVAIAILLGGTPDETNAATVPPAPTEQPPVVPASKPAPAEEPEPEPAPVATASASASASAEPKAKASPPPRPRRRVRPRSQPRKFDPWEGR